MKAKYKIAQIVADSSACSYYRAILPSIHCQPHAKDAVEVTLTDSPANLPGSDDDYDCFWFSRVYNQSILHYVLRLYEAGKKILWDLDDDLAAIPDWSPAKGRFSGYVISDLEYCLRISAAITTSTDRLREAISPRLPSIPADRYRVLENLVDTRRFDRFRDPRPPGRRDGPTRVIWTGSSSHTGDLAPFHEIFNKYRNDNSLTFITYGHFMEEYRREDPDRLVQLGWGPKKNYEATLCLLSPSISLAPLAEHRFNVCKSAIKYYESVMAGAAFIGAAMPPYSDVIMDGNDGFLAGPGGWEAAFDGLSSRPWRMAQTWRNSYTHVLENYSWNAANPRLSAWVDFYRSIPDLPSP